MKNLTNKIIQVLCLLLITSTMSLQAESVLKNNNPINKETITKSTYKKPPLPPLLELQLLNKKKIQQKLKLTPKQITEIKIANNVYQQQQKILLTKLEQPTPRTINDYKNQQNISDQQIMTLQQLKVLKNKQKKTLHKILNKKQNKKLKKMIKKKSKKLTY